MSAESLLMCCGGELEWSSPTDDDELPEVTGPAWIVDKVAHYGG
ncbi:aerotaxis sensor receptor, flavoprotein [Salmonella enterica]|nr:aerotaxis sensor receptor, flavoprotein [Salmonella enterica]